MQLKLWVGASTENVFMVGIGCWLQCEDEVDRNLWTWVRDLFIGSGTANPREMFSYSWAVVAIIKLGGSFRESTFSSFRFEGCWHAWPSTYPILFWISERRTWDGLEFRFGGTYLFCNVLHGGHGLISQKSCF